MPKLIRRRAFARTASGVLLAGAVPAMAQQRPLLPANTLPPTPPLPPAKGSGRLKVADVELFHADFGDGEPVLLLHGGMANANYWGHQIAELSRRHRVLVLDARGHGRSTLPDTPLSYRLLADDVLGFLDALKIERTAIVGWSDGAIVGLDIAMRRPERLSRLFAFGANFNLSGLRPDGQRTMRFTQYAERCRSEYAALSPAPANWPKLLAGLRRMWSSSPTWTTEQLARIRTRTVVAGAEHDEIIRQTHTAELAAASPGARLVVMSAVSHFAMLQDPAHFNAELAAFLRG
jgi:pimeloyl-ACP methyl ester carboxylesterase